MNRASLSPEHLQRAFGPGRDGVVGVVDDLLGMCPHEGFELDWRDGRCRVRPLGDGPRESAEVAMPKSVFRAILARIAALCNERVPGSVSPYGGEGELSFGAGSTASYRVAFTNAPGELRLEVQHMDRPNGTTADDASSRISTVGPL